MKKTFQFGIGACLVTSLLSFYAHDALARKKNKGPDVCKIFDDGPALALLGDKMQKSSFNMSVLASCTYKVDLPNAEERSKAYSQALMKHMTSGKKGKQPKRPQLENTIHLGLRSAKSAEAAKRKMSGFRQNNEKGVTVAVKGSPKSGYKSKVALGNEKLKESQSANEMTDAVEKRVKGQAKSDTEVSVAKTFQSATKTIELKGVDEAFFIVKGQTLMARKGKRIITIAVKIEGQNENESLQAAKSLAAAWLKN